MDRAIEAALAFASTNIDNFIMISVLLTLARSKADRRNVCAAQYIALAVLVLIGLLGAEIVSLIPDDFVRLLGILPIAVGLHGLFGRKSEADDDLCLLPTLWAQTALNLSGGMDNISVYIPLLERYNCSDILLMTVVFAGMMGLWYFMADKITALPGLRDRIRQRASQIVPWVYILLGVYIIIR